MSKGRISKYVWPVSALNMKGLRAAIKKLANVQKQPLADFFQNRCSYKFHNIHRKKPVLESLFNKATLTQVFFSVNIAKFSITTF